MLERLELMEVKMVMIHGAWRRENVKEKAVER